MPSSKVFRGLADRKHRAVVSLEAISKMRPKDYEDAAELDEAKEVLDVILITHNQASEVLQPRKQTFDLPTPAIAAQHPSILGLLATVRAMRRDKLDRDARSVGGRRMRFRRRSQLLDECVGEFPLRV